MKITVIPPACKEKALNQSVANKMLGFFVISKQNQISQLKVHGTYENTELIEAKR